MLSPYRSFITEKIGSKMIGQSIPFFRNLLKHNTIESSYRNGRILYINEYSLTNYIKQYGGKKERSREFIIDNIRDEQYKYISVILKNNNSCDLIHNYAVTQIKQWHKVYTEYHKNIKIIKTLKSIGFTEKLLSKNYGTDPIDVGFFKIKVSDDPKFKFRHFFNTYLQTKKDYETNFNFYVSYTVAKSIIKECKQKFK